MSDHKNFKCCVDARSFAKTALMQSTDETRYYLRGVYVEPAPASVGGVYLIATDGHAMVIRHDPRGYAEGSAIISLNKEMLKAAKGAKGYDNSVLVVRDGQAAIAWGIKAETIPETPATLDFGAANVNAVQMREVIVDGSFPDWRRIIPQDLKLDAPVGNFDAKLLARLAKALATPASTVHPIQLTGTEDGLKAPVLARGSDLDAFGVVMPIINLGGFRFVPDWFKKFEEV